jgi:hypothetical protein
MDRYRVMVLSERLVPGWTVGPELYVKTKKEGSTCGVENTGIRESFSRRSGPDRLAQLTGSRI